MAAASLARATGRMAMNVPLKALAVAQELPASSICIVLLMALSTPAAVAPRRKTPSAERNTPSSSVFGHWFLEAPERLQLGRRR